MQADAHVSRRMALTSLFGLGSAALLGACASEDSLTRQAREGDNKNYVAGDGSVTEYRQNQRGEPVEFTATGYQGESMSAESLRGKPAVLNVWYAACAPCRKEAPTLAQLSDSFADQVQFMGINVRDSEGTAAAFERTFNISYPSVPDVDGSLLMSLSQYVPPQAVPTTVVLDKQGRVSARVIGVVQENILRTLIDTVLGESDSNESDAG